MQRFGLSSSWDNVWVVFSPYTDLLCLKFLKTGFKHCFLILENDGAYFVVDPISYKVEVSSFFLESNLFFQRLENLGMKILKVSFVQNQRKSWTFGIFTCVEVVKRILGISKKRVLTPYQLYKYLLK